MAEIRTIITDEDSLLHEKSVEVKRFGTVLHKLLDDMKVTMYHANGIGLAAPQVGILKQVVVIDDREHGFIELINPRITERSGSLTSTEFCLSVPDIGGRVKRSKNITVVAQDRYGATFTKKVSGDEAIVYQHEIDHLSGVLFTDIMFASVKREDYED